MVRTQIQLTENQFKILKDVSHRENLPVAELIRRGVDSYLNGKIAVSKEDLRKRALDIAGKYRSGKRDLSSKHDKYLAEAFK